MSEAFPGAVPEIPVSSVSAAIAYYEQCLGFRGQGGSDGGFGQVCRGSCRLFLTDQGFRDGYGDLGVRAPVVIWLNLDNRNEVDVLYQAWRRSGARILCEPESKPWHLHEFTAQDLDGNLLRVFYDFAWELQPATISANRS